MRGFTIFLFLFSKILFVSGRFHDLDLPTTKPLNIAHRGASGIVPENTKEAFQLAVDQGADLVETDLVVTRDLHVLCLHESWIGATTNIADLYPESRMSTYYIDVFFGNVTDYFTVDFTLEELKDVRINQRFRQRDPGYDGLFAIATLEEYIEIIQNSSRPVGLNPETKDTAWVNSLDFMIQANVTIEKLLVDTLHQYGYSKKSDPCVLQSFSEDSVRRMSEMTDLPVLMLFLIELDNSTLERWSTFCYAIGPNKAAIVTPGLDNRIWFTSQELVDTAHKLGMRVHAWTFRNEHDFMPYDYGSDPYEEYRMLLDMGIDAAITDFPQTYTNYLKYRYDDETEITTSAPPIASEARMEASHFFYLVMASFFVIISSNWSCF